MDDPCFRPGYLFGNGDASDVGCSSPPPRATLLAVHAPQHILDHGVAQGWWKSLHFPNPASPSSLSSVDLVATPNGQPYATALLCSKACTVDSGCGGFSSTHGICLLRGKIYQPVQNAMYSADTACRAMNAAIFSDSVAGPGDEAAKAAGKCTRSERKVPQPAGEWFDKCDVPRCTNIEDSEEGDWYDWLLGAPFPEGHKDFVYFPRSKKCYFPMYNRSEIRTLLGGQGAPPGTETWVILSGGSNSYGMGASVMKAVHNVGGEKDLLVANGDVLIGRGISFDQAQLMNRWQKNCIVDTIRHLDGTSTVRVLPGAGCGQKGWNMDDGRNAAWDEKVLISMREWLKEMETYFTPGAIRVTHIKSFYFSVFGGIVDVVGPMTKNGPWKKLLLWGHSIQRYSGVSSLKRDVAKLVLLPTCNRLGEVLCVIGTKYGSTPNILFKNAQAESTYPHSMTHLLDTDQMAKGNRYESQASHRLQSHHLFHFQIMLNQWDLDYSGLTQKQRAKAVAHKGCPEALTFPAQCHANGGTSGPYNDQNSVLCDFDRDPITPKKGLPAFYVPRTSDDIDNPGGGGPGSGVNPGNNMGSGICGTNVYDFDLRRSIEGHGNRTLMEATEEAALKEKNRTAEMFGSKKLSRLCRGRIWCGFETQAWGLGLGSAFLVGCWWTFKMVWLELKRDQESEISRLKSAETTSSQKNKNKNKNKNKSGRHQQRRVSLDPGNGGHRGGNRRSKKRGHGHTRSIVSKKELGGNASSHDSRSSSVLLSWSKPMSTTTGERLTSLGPARFMASMHIVAGHLYQKSALGPLYLLSWGYTWVPWFFMLSGYVLMHARLNSRTPDKVDAPLTALWKRTSSIFPMYAVGVGKEASSFFVASFVRDRRGDIYILLRTYSSLLFFPLLSFFFSSSPQCWTCCVFVLVGLRCQHTTF